MSGEIFYANTEYNIKLYALGLLETYINQALAGTLTSPSTNAGFYAFYDSNTATNYNTTTISRNIRYGLNIIEQQLSVDTYYTKLQEIKGIKIPTKTYGVRDLLGFADFAYGTQSDALAEIETQTENSGKIVQVYKRFRIDGDITDGPYTMNETVQKQGDASITGVVYGFHTDDNYKYLDVRVTAGVWQVTDNVVGATNSTTAQVSAIEDRIHIIDVKGGFENDIPFKGYTSGNTASPTNYFKTQAAITDNTGGSLTVDTASLIGTFEVNSVVYPTSSRRYFDVVKKRLDASLFIYTSWQASKY